MMGKVRSRERALLFRSLQVLFDAGVTLPRSLRILQEQVKDKALSDALAKIEERVLSGISFSQSVKEWPFLFSDHCRRTIEVAEASGALPQVLKRLAEFEEKAYQTELLFRRALIYPFWILFVCCIFVLWVPPYLFGELFRLLENSGVELPLLSRMVLGFSKVVGSPFFYLFCLLLLILGHRLVVAVRDNPRNQYRLFLLMHHSPVLHSHLVALATCRFARCLELMSEVGVPITQTLKLAGNASGDPLLMRRMPEAIDMLIHGATLETSLDATDFFTPTFLSTVRLGQESGALSEVMSKIALLYEAELEYRAEILIGALEPLAMLMMGLTVGVFIIATMSPLMTLIQSL